jgi:cell division protein FtsB
MINDNETRPGNEKTRDLEWQVEHLRRRYDELAAENKRLRLEIRRLNEKILGSEQ